MKKGISPLIASVVLIAFVIAVGAIAVTFFTGFSESTKLGIEQKKSGSVSCALAALEIDKDAISISDLKFHTKYVGKFNTQTPESVYVSEDFAYLTSYSAGYDKLIVINISDPTNPQQIGENTTSLDEPYSVYVSGSYAYVASYKNDKLVIFNVSDNTNPIYIGENNTSLDGPTSVFVSGDYAYLVNEENSKLVIFNISNKTNPTLVGEISTCLSYPHSVYISENYAYVASDNSRVCIFNVSDPSNPIHVKTVDYPGNVIAGPYSVFISGGNMFVTGTDANYLIIYDITDPENPIYLAKNKTSMDRPISVFISGDYAYLACCYSENFVVFDVSDPSNPTYVAENNTELYYPTSIFVSGNYVYVTDIGGDDKLAIFNTYTTKDVKIDIENIGQTDLSGLKIIVYDENGAHTLDASPESISKASKLTISTEDNLGTVTKIKVISTDCPGVESIVEKENGEWKLKR